MNFYSKLLLLLGILCLFQLQASAQDDTLTEYDKQAIQYKSKDFIKELASLMNLICDPNVEEYKRKEIINNSFSINANQIFFNEDVIIEDDIDPNFFDWQTSKNLKVSRYLNDLDLFYTKSESPTITITNVKAFEVKQADYIFLPVYFETTFTGNHLVINKAYQTVKRIATIMARKEGNLWKPLIVSIVHYNPSVHKFVEDANKPIIETGQVADNVADSLNKAIVDSLQIYPEEKTVVTENTNIETEATFKQYPDAVRKGKTEYISWDKGKWDSPVKLELYQNDNLINVININTDVNNQLWSVPKNAELGTGYQLKISNIEDPKKEIFSPEFQIKRGFPLGLKILGAAAIVGTAAVLLSGGSGGGDPGTGGGDNPTVDISETDPFVTPDTGN
ncbi:hypothetical protein [Chondrinema litorale]|uniref:hypothetical protein n=1 Tax=Chondrinema litorale TaxID=2994555 RepID=UPI002542CCDA|nr:hypothetical protein [Chondrinema litorale]UZR97041.1 hypothetical protein OQ292_23365 [Chondrinema litorale]